MLRWKGLCFDSYIWPLEKSPHDLWGWRCCNCLYISTNCNMTIKWPFSLQKPKLSNMFNENILPTIWCPSSYLQINIYVYVPSTARIQPQDFSVCKSSPQRFSSKQQSSLYKWPMEWWCNSCVKEFGVWTGDFPCGLSRLPLCLWGFVPVSSLIPHMGTLAWLETLDCSSLQVCE